MIVKISDFSILIKKLATIDKNIYDCYFVPMAGFWFRPKVTTKGRDTYMFSDISLDAIAKVKAYWGEEKVLTIDGIYPEDRWK